MRVGRECEHDVGVAFEAVHLVEQLEEQRPLAGSMVQRAVLGDEVDVLEHHDRRLQARVRSATASESMRKPQPEIRIAVQPCAAPMR